MHVNKFTATIDFSNGSRALTKHRMKKIIAIVVIFCLPINLSAQTSRREIALNKNLSGNNYVAYPESVQNILTPAPKGYSPFYISHYGRHGSRYLINVNDYNKPFETLTKANQLGKLTLFGKDVLRRVTLFRKEAKGREGELTVLGAQQHKAIAWRMYKRFPRIFSGRAVVDAKSTVVIRCILSMENALQQLLVLNPRLQIKHDASYHDMYYMNYCDKHLDSLKMTSTAKEAYTAFSSHHDNCDTLMRKLFNDEAYWRNSINALKLNDQLYHLACNVQNTELRHSETLYDLYTDEELYNNWLRKNAWWYINYGPSPLNGGIQVYSQRVLICKIIEEADSCIVLEHPGITLRYGHDTMMMPLVCLLNINGYGRKIADLEKLDDENWCNYRLYPMACNLQFVFYRRTRNEKDVLFKVLLNENEATLPIPAVKGFYYHWKDFKAFVFRKLQQYKE